MKKRLLSVLVALSMAMALLPPGTVLAVDPETDPAAGLETGFAEIIAADAGEDGIMPLTTIDDHTPPVVTEVTMNSPGGTVTVGDTLYFSVSVEDESGISSGHLEFTFVCEQEHEHTVYAYYYDDYNEDTKQAKFELTITDDMLNGTYMLSEVYIRDTYGNRVYYDPEYPGNIDFDAVCFTITGSSATEDHDPPVVTAVSMEESGKVVTPGDTLYFSVSVEDESGISSGHLEFTFVCEQEHEHTVYAYYYDNDNEDTKQAKFELTITDDMLNGTYMLSEVYIRDTYGNRVYYDPEYPGNIDFDAVCFTITGSSATEDHDPPVVTAVSMEESGKVVTPGDTLYFSEPVFISV